MAKNNEFQSRTKLRDKVKKIAWGILGQKNGFVKEDPTDIMRNTLDEFKNQVRDDGISILEVDGNRLRDTSEGDMKVEFEQEWRYDFMIPYEKQGKEQPISCFMHFNNYWLGRSGNDQRREINGTFDCDLSKEGVKELERTMLNRNGQRIIKKGNDWEIEDL